jgi:hypothetical protein
VYFWLLGKVNVPLLNGEVVIERLQGQGLGTRKLQWRLDGLLTSISLPALCGTLGWVPLSGKLSGVIPGVRYADRRLDVGGALLVLGTSWWAG